MRSSTRGAGEDAVVGDERNPKADGGGRDPAITVVDLRGEGVAGSAAVVAKPSAERDRQVVGLRDLEQRDRALEASGPKLARARAKRAVAQFEDRLEGQDDGTAPTAAW